MPQARIAVQPGQKGQGVLILILSAVRVRQIPEQFSAIALFRIPGPPVARDFSPEREQRLLGSGLAGGEQILHG